MKHAIAALEAAQYQANTNRIANELSGNLKQAEAEVEIADELEEAIRILRWRASIGETRHKLTEIKW